MTDIRSTGTALSMPQDAEYMFLELTRSICPECKIPIDTHVIARNNNVYLRKRRPEHGAFESLVYADQALDRFRGEGLIEVGPRFIRILDSDGLASYRL